MQSTIDNNITLYFAATNGEAEFKPVLDLIDRAQEGTPLDFRFRYAETGRRQRPATAAFACADCRVANLPDHSLAGFRNPQSRDIDQAPTGSHPFRHTAHEPALISSANIAASNPCSVVKRGSDLALNPGGVIVLNPQLRVVLFHEFFDHLAALRGLLPIRVGGRNFLVRDLFRIMIEIAR